MLNWLCNYLIRLLRLISTYMPRPSLNPHPPHLSLYKNNSCIICPNNCPLPPSQLPCVSLSAMCFSIFSTILLPLCPVSSSPHLMLHPQLEHFHSDPLTYLQPFTTNALIFAPGFGQNPPLLKYCSTTCQVFCPSWWYNLCTNWCVWLSMWRSIPLTEHLMSALQSRHL